MTLFQDTKFTPPLLLRRTPDDAGITDEAYIGGAWQPTKRIIDFTLGHNDFVDVIDEVRAGVVAPGALVD